MILSHSFVVSIFRHALWIYSIAKQTIWVWIRKVLLCRNDIGWKLQVSGFTCKFLTLPSFNFQQAITLLTSPLNVYNLLFSMNWNRQYQNLLGLLWVAEVCVFILNFLLFHVLCTMEIWDETEFVNRSAHLKLYQLHFI